MLTYKTPSHTIKAASFGVVFVLLGASHALAVQNISSCGATVTSQNAKLTANLTQSGAGDCIVLSNGRDLDLDGYTITCTSGPCGSAVVCNPSGGSNVDSLVEGSGLITGAFDAAIDDCGTVRDTKIVGAATGILFDDSGTDGKDYYRNVILDCDIGMDVVLRDNVDSIHDNRIDGGSTAMTVIGAVGSTSGDGPHIFQNVIRGFADYGFYNNDAYPNGTYMVWEDNIVIEGDPGSDAMSYVYAHIWNAGQSISESDAHVGGCELDSFLNFNTAPDLAGCF